MNKIVLGVLIMISTTALAQDKIVNPVAVEAVATKGMPLSIAEKIAAKRAAVESKVEAKTAQTNKARVKDGDWLLLHDGSTVKQFRQIDPFDEVSFPAALTCVIDTKEKCEKEIEKLGK